MSDTVTYARDKGFSQTGVTAKAQTTVRNAGSLLVQRGVQIVGVFVFATLIPRLMGPETYGRYTLVTSLSRLFVLLSGLGLTQVIGRYVPQFVLEEDVEHLRSFFRRLLSVRLVSGTVTAGLYFILTVLWLRDLDPLVLALVAGAVFVRAVATLFFTFFLGLNRAALWGMGQVVRGWISLALLLPGFLLGGLRGVCFGLLVAELAVLLIGMWKIRRYVSWPRPRLDVHRLAPYLQFGLTFFASTLLLTAFQHSGQAMVRMASNDYAQVGYFGTAYSIYLAPALALPELTKAFAPLFTTLLLRGQIGSLRQWAERLLKWLAIGGMLVAFGALFMARSLVPLVLGVAYRPVAANLLPLTMSLLALALSGVARLLALVFDRPKVALAAAGVRLVAFWGIGPPLVAWRGSFGGCLGLLAASVLYGGYLTWRMQRVVHYSLRAWALAIALGVPFLPLVWLPSVLGVSSWLLNAGLYGVFVVGYGGALIVLRVVTRGEITAMWRIVGSKGLLG